MLSFGILKVHYFVRIEMIFILNLIVTG